MTTPKGDTAESIRTARKLTRFWPLYSGVVALVAVAALGALIAFRDNNLPLSFDTTWMNEVIEHRSPLWTAPALVMNSIGGGIVATVILPVVVIGVLCLRRRFWSALFYAIATALSGALVQLLKFSFERPRPTDILVTADLGSFPSGHTANAATLAVILGIVLQRTWVWFAGVIYAVAMAVSRTYLGAHWLSDTIGGLVLGAAVVVIVWTPLATRMHAERDRGRARRLAARRDSVGA